MEITFQTYQNRFLLKPGSDLRKLFVGVLGRSLELYPVRLHSITVLSNHLHILCSPDNVRQMSGFVQHLKANVSKQVGRLHNWTGGVFADRYHAIPVSDEPEAQIARLRYHLSQGCKEGLVSSPHQWPGVQSATALTRGEPLVGEWLDCDGFRAARRKDPKSRRADFVTRYEVELKPLGCWGDLPAAAWRAELERLVASIEEETREMHQRAGTRPLGARRACLVRPDHRPKVVERSPAPRVHAFKQRVRLELEEGLRRFVEAYREASRQFQAGARHAVFPDDCWLPCVASVTAGAT